jgi:hypothetical protein
MAEATVLNPGNIFNSLAANGTGEASPLARALRAALIDPQTRNAVDEAPSATQPGFALDLPAIVSRPLTLNAENVLLLAAQSVTTRIESLLDEVDALQGEIRTALDRANLASGNPAGALLSSLDFAALRQAAQPAEEEAEAVVIAAGAARNANAVLGDFGVRPKEKPVFGSSFSGLATDASLRTQFEGRVALSEGERVSLADLILAETAAGGNAREFAVALTGGLQEDGTLADARGSLVDDNGDPIANGTLIAEADLDTTFFVAATNIRALDYLSVIEQRQSGGVDPNERGSLRTVSLSTSLAPRDRVEIEEEKIRDFRFFTESGTAFTSIQLDFEGVDDEGVTEIVDAIAQGYVRVQVTETLDDGSENQAVVDLRESSANRLQADFAFGPAQAGVETTGLKVELRALDPAFDISGISIRAILG